MSGSKDLQNYLEILQEENDSETPGYSMFLKYKVCYICLGNFQQYAEPGQQPREYCQQVRYMVSRGVLPASRY